MTKGPKRGSVSEVETSHLPDEMRMLTAEVLRILLSALTNPITTLWTILLTLFKVAIAPVRNFGQIITFMLAKMEVMRLGQNHTAVNLFYNRLRKTPNKEALVFEDKIFTFQDMEDHSNRIAHWAKSLGLKKGDVVAIYMENCPEFVFTWLGLAKMGITAALINRNLIGTPLEHCIKISTCKVIISDEKGLESLSQIMSKMVKGKDLTVKKAFFYSSSGKVSETISMAGGAKVLNMEQVLSTQSKERPDLKFLPSGSDTLFYIYTSGTTGLPKASIFLHFRLMFLSVMGHWLIGIRESDRVYVTLPLYHASATTLGVGISFKTGTTVVLAKKFSVRNYWNDCRKYNATVILYIGEMCRYLLGSPEQQNDCVNNIRLACGNGLRPDVWGPFVKRFNIGSVAEFYGSTEGNVGMGNVMNKVGAVGFMTPLLAPFYPVKLLKYDNETGQLVRDPKTGFCIPCSDNEPGEMVNLINVEKDPMLRFDGYLNNEGASSSKIAFDVFAKGDKYFRTGDLLQRDFEGFYFFVDRIGDTFRWKGENVSTNEVAEIMNSCPEVLEANVYGVTVPKNEGRAGMAALVMKEVHVFNPIRLYKTVSENLPKYAQPIFVRLLQKMATTSTFKYSKVDLRKEGYDRKLCGDDPLYVIDHIRGTYAPFTDEYMEEVSKGNARL
eukprot:Nk52_evm15s232 gene=Nk52_evmTU15s232